MDASFTLGCRNDQTLFQDVSTVGGQIYDMTHADDVIRECKKAPTLNARMGTGGNQVPIVTENIPNKVMSTMGGQNYTIPHDERSASYVPNISDPLTHYVHYVSQELNVGAEPIYSLSHDQRSSQFTPGITDPLTKSDYKQPIVVAQEMEKCGEQDV